MKEGIILYLRAINNSRKLRQSKSLETYQSEIKKNKEKPLTREVKAVIKANLTLRS